MGISDATVCVLDDDEFGEGKVGEGKVGAANQVCWLLRKHAVNTSLYAPPPHPCGGGFAAQPTHLLDRTNYRPATVDSRFTTSAN